MSDTDALLKAMEVFDWQAEDGCDLAEKAMEAIRALKIENENNDSPAWQANEELNHALHAMRADRDRLAAAWLRVIQAENSCVPPTGKPCDAKRCGCKAEQDMLIKDAAALIRAKAQEPTT
jgi:hypothetical protein